MKRLIDAYALQEWICGNAPVFKDYIYYTCSECYRKPAIKELYCPHCGAKMDGGEEDA